MTWQSETMALITASLVRPLVLAAAAWLILRVLKVRHPASRHAVWAAVLAGMLFLPLASVMIPHWKLPVLPRRKNPVTQTPLRAIDTNDYDASGFTARAVPTANFAPVIHDVKVF